MKRPLIILGAVAALAIVLVARTWRTGPDTPGTVTAGSDSLIAVDVLLQPDRRMIASADSLNARLRGDYPSGYSLDATHAPHITLLQCYVRARDLGALTTAIAGILTTVRPTELELEAQAVVYTFWGGVALTLINVGRTPELMRLQERVVQAAGPFAVRGGTAAAFAGGEANAETVAWVEGFMAAATGARYSPHVTAGVASEPFVKRLIAEPYTHFTFRPTGVALYQLGNFGTAARELWRSPDSQ